MQEARSHEYHFDFWELIASNSDQQNTLLLINSKNMTPYLGTPVILSQMNDVDDKSN
jgi:hypothetical protein